MPAVTGVLETSLYVADLERSTAFYTNLCGFEVLVSDDRMTAMAVAPGQVLLLFRHGGSAADRTSPGGTIPGHDGSGQLHTAFSVSADSLAEWETTLAGAAVDVEQTVRWPGGAVSIYFRDPDDHLIELVTPGLWANY